MAANEDKAGPPSDATEFYRQWAWEAVRDNLRLVNDALARLVSVNALLTGGVILLTDSMLIVQFLAAEVLLLVALLCALKGLLSQVTTDVSGLSAEEMRQHARRILESKAWWLQRSVTALVFGLALAIVGVAMRFNFSTLLPG